MILYLSIPLLILIILIYNYRKKIRLNDVLLVSIIVVIGCCLYKGERVEGLCLNTDQDGTHDCASHDEDQTACEQGRTRAGAQVCSYQEVDFGLTRNFRDDTTADLQTNSRRATQDDWNEWLNRGPHCVSNGISSAGAAFSSACEAVDPVVVGGVDGCHDIRGGGGWTPACDYYPSGSTTAVPRCISGIHKYNDDHAIYQILNTNPEALGQIMNWICSQPLSETEPINETQCHNTTIKEVAESHYHPGATDGSPGDEHTFNVGEKYLVSGQTWNSDIGEQLYAVPVTGSINSYIPVSKLKDVDGLEQEQLCDFFSTTTTPGTCTGTYTPTTGDCSDIPFFVGSYRTYSNCPMNSYGCVFTPTIDDGDQPTGTCTGNLTTPVEGATSCSDIPAFVASPTSSNCPTDNGCVFTPTNDDNPVNFKLEYSKEGSSLITSVYNCDSTTTDDSNKISCPNEKTLDTNAQTKGIFGGTLFSWLTGKPNDNTAKTACCK